MWLKKLNFKWVSIVFCIILIWFLPLEKEAVAYGGGVNKLSNPEMQDIIIDNQLGKNEISGWKILYSNLRVNYDNGGYSDGKGSRGLHYFPAVESRPMWSGHMEAVEWSGYDRFGYITHGPPKKIYVGNKPFVVAFKEKRSSKSFTLNNIWSVRVYSYAKDSNGTLKMDYNAYYATSDRKFEGLGEGYDHKFHSLDGTTNPDVKALLMNGLQIM